MALTMAITRRSFLAGLGSVSVGLLFRRQLDRVLESLERDLVDEPVAPDQLPSAAEIVVVPQAAFRPERLFVAGAIAELFVIEDIRIGGKSQFHADTSIPASMFMPSVVDNHLSLDAAASSVEIRFRVRYVGNDPRGARFQAALIGKSLDGPGRMVLPIDSGIQIVA